MRRCRCGRPALAKLWMDSAPAFDLLNADAAGPVVLSVPHAGRDYDPRWTALLRPPVERIVALEDRYADALAAAVTNAPILIGRKPRLYIDLNRHPAEIDPGLVEGAIASRLMLTPKVRSGLGLVPRRLADAGELWRRRLSLADVEARAANIHRPFHDALAGLLARALARNGVAVLLDLHSMPKLAGSGEALVIGNRFGQSAGAWATARVIALAGRHGLSWRENSPYAGGYVTERHGTPARGVHAVQLEVDRSLYLDDELDRPHPRRAPRLQTFIADLVDELAQAALDTALPLAAE